MESSLDLGTSLPRTAGHSGHEVPQVQFSSVQSLSHVWLCDPMNRSMPGLPVHHQLPEFTQSPVIESVMPSSHLILCRPNMWLWRDPADWKLALASCLYKDYIITTASCRPSTPSERSSRWRSEIRLSVLWEKPRRTGLQIVRCFQVKIL